MNFSDLLKAPYSWLGDSVNHSDIVITSRIRIARNLEGFLFPGWAKEEDRISVLKEIYPALDQIPQFQGSFSDEVLNLSSVEKQILVERHLISREHASKSKGCSFIIDKTQSISLMINEEDHIRMQLIKPGLQLESSWEEIDSIDSKLESKLSYAFSDKYGYITSCPTNIGTGVRVSAMLHLPGLVLSEQIDKTIYSANKIGLIVRGFYGEGTEALANLFQISNQNTLGVSESELIISVNKVILNLINNEKNARLKILEDNPVMLKDQVGRSYGILKNSYTLNSKEALNHLSFIRLGCDLGFIGKEHSKTINSLFIKTQPAHLQMISKCKLTSQERDELRADIIRNNLKNLSVPNFDITFM